MHVLQGGRRFFVTEQAADCPDRFTAQKRHACVRVPQIMQTDIVKFCFHTDIEPEPVQPVPGRTQIGDGENVS